jgi:hypothetical protein
MPPLRRDVETPQEARTAPALSGLFVSQLAKPAQETEQETPAKKVIEPPSTQNHERRNHKTTK